MKFAKKIMMLLLVASLLAACLALSSSAQSPERTPDYYERIFEYGSSRAEYFGEDFQSYGANQDYVLTGGVMKFLGAGTIIDAEGEKMLKLSVAADAENSKAGELYYRWQDGQTKPKTLVTTFSVTFGDADADNGASLALIATLDKFVDELPLLTIDATSKGSAKATYVTFDELFVEFGTETVDIALNNGTSYDVEVIFNANEGRLDISISNGAESVLSVNVLTPQLEGSRYMESVRLTVDNLAKKTATATCIDDIYIYEGAFVRDVTSETDELAGILLEMDEYANDAARTIDERLAMANIYKRFFPSYTPDSALDSAVFEKLAAIKAGAEGYRQKADAYALISYAAQIENQPDCYAKERYQNDVVKPFYNKFETVDGVAGMEDIFEGEVTYGAKVLEAKAAYDTATETIARTKRASLQFVKLLEEGYDSESQDYLHMTSQRDILATWVDYVDPAFKYGETNPESVYVTAKEALDVYNELVAKIQDIETTANDFISKTSLLTKEISATVSKADPYYTDNFETLYPDYLSAEACYDSDYGVHNKLDEATYPNLSEAIALFKEYQSYIEERIADCNDFIALINTARDAGLFQTRVACLAEAGKYLDDNIEYSLERYTGIVDVMDGDILVEKGAVTLYDELCKAVEDDIENAADYKNAVAQININAPYAQLKAQYNAALDLKAKGDITGIDGIAEANMALIAAQSKLSVFESNSQSFIDLIANIKKTADLKERRKLIFNAEAIKENTVDDIDGVSTAKAELVTLKASYESDAAAANAVLGAASLDAASIGAATAPTSTLYTFIDVVKALFK